jgi:membrane protein implicated in regulation of membrane protease activity
MSSDITFAILFGGLALLAQYLPAKWGIPIGFVMVALSIWLLGWVGWPLALAIILIALVVWRIFSHRGLFEKDKEKERKRIEKREQAQKIHNKIMDLFLQLEKEEDNLPKDEDWQHNLDIRSILDELQIELNNLGYLINNSDYDRWVEDMMSVYSKKLRFHIKNHDSEFSEWGRARINAKFRAFINKIKG